MLGEEVALLKLALVHAFGDRFRQGAVDIPWVNRVTCPSCLVKEAMWILMWSMTLFRLRLGVLNSESALISWALSRAIVLMYHFCAFSFFQSLRIFLPLLKPRSVSWSNIQVMDTWIFSNYFKRIFQVGYKVFKFYGAACKRFVYWKQGKWEG